MSSNVVNQNTFLRTTRQFPEELHQLTVEIDRSYVDIANAVNVRTIGIFPTNRFSATGESFFLVGNRRQQTFRQVYTFTGTTAINHGIRDVVPNQFTKCSGSYTNGTDSFGLFFASSVAIAGQITFYVTSTQIIFLVGAGAPALSSGRIILEWLSQP